MNRPIARLSALLAVLACFSGCAPSKLVVKNNANVSLGWYKVLEVADIENPNDYDIPQDVLDYLSNRIVERVGEEKLYTTRKVGEGSGSEKKVMRLSCKLVRYEKGNRAARWLIGFGVGAGSMGLSCRLTDKSRKQELITANISGSIVMGSFGGDEKDAARSIVSEILKLLRDNYR